MRSKKVWWLGFLGLFAVGCLASNAVAQQTTTELDPMKIMRQTCDYLKSLKQFSFRSEVADDHVYHAGKKLQYGIELETFVRRPDRLRVNAEGDLVNKQFFFNGKAITLYDRTAQVYATMEVPNDIEGALEKAQKDFQLRVALADLASPMLWEHFSGRVRHSLYVGLHKVRGVPCHHLAFDGDEVHLQLWIDAGEKPLPRKVVFTQKKSEASPQWTAYLTDWNLSPILEDGLFSFAAPTGAKKVEIVPVKRTSEPGTDKGGKS